MDETVIRKYKSGDEIKILVLLKKIFPGWITKENALDFWIWKYISTPSGSDIVLAEQNSNIVGIGHRINLSSKIGERTQLCQYGDDFGVDPEYREGGVYRKIMELIEKERIQKKISTMYTQTSNPIVAKDNLKRGRLPFPHKITRLIKVKDVNTHFKFKPYKNDNLIRRVFPILKILNKISSHMVSIKKSKSDIKIIDIFKFDENINNFWDKIRNDYYFTLEKNKEYLDWRYLDKRGGNYFIKQAVQNNEIVGYITYELIEENNYLQIYILDLLTLPNRSDVAYLLIKDICNFFDNSNINAMYYQTVANHTYQKIFSKLGFINSYSTPYIFLVITKEDFEIIKKTKPNQISFTYGNTLH